MIKGLRTTIYKVSDLARAKVWYGQAFGLDPYFDEPLYVGFNVGGFELGLAPDAPAAPGPGGVLTYWGVDDVETTYGVCSRSARKSMRRWEAASRSHPSWSLSATSSA